MSESYPTGVPALTWSPDAARSFGQRFGLASDAVDAMLAEENALLAAAWAAYRRRHPNGTVRAFGLEQVEQAALDALLAAGVPRSRARALARNARRRAEEHAP